MAMLLFLRVFCIIYVFRKTSLIGYAEAIPQGDYKLKLISLEKCKLPDKNWYKNAPIAYSFAAKKVDRQTTVIKVQFAIKARDGPVFFTVRGYQVQQNSAKDLIFHLENISCKNPLSFNLVKVIKLKLDTDCYAVPGNYTADKINIDDFSTLLTKAMVGPGKYSYDLEFITAKGVAVCIAVTADITRK